MLNYSRLFEWYKGFYRVQMLVIVILAIFCISPVQTEAGWQFTGGPRGGIGYDIRINPLNHNNIWVTDANAGVHVTYNGGNTWQAKNNGISARAGSTGDSFPIFSLAIDPIFSNTIYVGTKGIRGIFKSVDGGRTWQKKDQGIANHPSIEIRSFTVDPTDSNVVYSGGNYQSDASGIKQRGFIYKSIDKGETWRLLHRPAALVRWIIVDPTNPKVIYASTGIFDRRAVKPEGVLKSTDGGQTWKNINTGFTSKAVASLAMHPTNSNILIGGTGKAVDNLDEPGELFGGLFKTINGGESWQQVTPSELIGHWNRFSAVAFAPSNPDIVYADTGGLFLRSQDGGESWTVYDVGASDGDFRGQPIALAVHPADPDVIYMNSYDGGVFLSLDGGRTWQDSSKGYTGAQIWGLSVSPSNANYVLAGTKGSAFLTTNGGGSWRGLMTKNSIIVAILSVAIDPYNQNTFIIGDEIDGRIERTTNGGRAWSTVLGPLGQNSRFGRRSINRIVFDPTDSSVVFAATGISTMTVPGNPNLTGPGVFKSTDNGGSWFEINNGLGSNSRNVMDLAVNPKNTSELYIGTLKSGVFKSTDGGNSWSSANGGLGINDVISISVDPNNPNRILAGGNFSGLWKSEDAGTTWRLSAAGMPAEATVSDIKFNPVRPNHVYACDRFSGVYKSTNGGQTWIQINQGLRNRSINALAISADGTKFYAATDGGGVYRMRP